MDYRNHRYDDWWINYYQINIRMKMNEEKELFTRDQLNIELLRQKDREFERSLDRIESTQKWMLGLMGTGFIGLLSLMAHGFKWIN